MWFSQRLQFATLSITMIEKWCESVDTCNAFGALVTELSKPWTVFHMSL